MMDPILITDAARAGHFAGLAFGLGLAFCADALAFSTVFRTITERDIVALRWMHRVITAGLILLWVSGLALLGQRTGWDVEAFSPKLMTKLAVVTVLSLNALLIGGQALRMLSVYVGYRFGDVGTATRLHLSAIAGVSLTCWVCALSLGVFTQLKPMEFEALIQTLSPVAAVCLSAPLLVGIFSPVVCWISRLFTRRQTYAAYA